MDTFKLYLAGKIVDVSEAKMTPDQMKKREKIAKAIQRDNPDMPMDKKMAIATKSAMSEGKMKDLAMKIDRVASNMRKDRMMKPFADKFKKDAMKSMNVRKSLEKVLPDYVAGKTLDKVMKEEVNEMHCKDCGCQYGNIDPNCDCPNDGSNPEGKHWVKDTNEAMGGRLHRMKMLDKMKKASPRAKAALSKSYNTKSNVGKAKYVVNFHDGEKTHKDGSPFYDMSIFKNAKDLKNFEKQLKSKGYVKEAVEVNERNYRKEYDNYQGRPEQIANRSSRNSARRIMGDKAVKGMDVGHKDNNPLNNDPKNLQMEDPSENRREPRTREVEEKATDKRMRNWHKDYDFDQDRDIVKGFVSPKAKSMAKKMVKDAVPMVKATKMIRSKFPGMKLGAISDLLKKEGLPQALKAKDSARRKEYNAFQKARRK